MITYFPQLRPDELFYSAVARYQAVMRVPSLMGLRQTLFGSAGHTAVIDLPGHFSELLERLPRGHPYNSEVLIREHTLFPFYAPFVSPERAAQSLSVMVEGETRGIHRLLNVTGTAVRAPTTLRICRGCADAQLAKYQHAYWRRVHQVPGILACPDHQRPLADTTVPRTGRLERYGYVHLTKELIGSAREINLSEVLLKKALPLAEDAQWLLTAKVDGKDSPQLRTTYRQIARADGWTDAANRLMVRPFERAVVDFYTPGFFDLAGISLRAPGSGDTWIYRIMQFPEVSFSPIRHLALLHFFGESVRTLLGASELKVAHQPGEESYSPPRTSRFLQDVVHATPCRNPLCDQYNPEGVASLVGSTAGPRYSFVACPECGFHYKFDNNCARMWSIINTGPVWDGELRRLVLETPQTQGEIAKQLGVTPNLLVRLAWDQGVVRPQWRRRKEPASTTRSATPEMRSMHRARVLRAVQDNPEAPRTSIRRADATAFAWLERHDREWLDKHVPIRRKPGRVSAVHWRERDALLVVQVPVAVFRIKAADGRRRRVSVSALGRTLGLGGTPANALRHLPKTAAAVVEAVESDHAYAVRRVRWAADQYRSEGVMPTGPSALARRAGIATRWEAEALLDIVGEFELVRSTWPA